MFVQSNVSTTSTIKYCFFICVELELYSIKKVDFGTPQNANNNPISNEMIKFSESLFNALKC